MRKNNCRISIVTTVYNGEKYIAETIESVISQSYPHFEYVIIDSCSTDLTAEICKSFRDDRIKYMNIKDSGIYEGMNNGIGFCSGDVVGIINADDYYRSSSVFQQIADTYNEADNSLYYYGDCDYVDENNNYITTHFVAESGALAHPAVFVKRSTYLRYGLYRTSYKVFSDAHYFNAIIPRRSGKKIDSVIAVMRAGGESSRLNLRNIKELARLRRDLGVHPAYITAELVRNSGIIFLQHILPRKIFLAVRSVYRRGRKFLKPTSPL